MGLRSRSSLVLIFLLCDLEHASLSALAFFFNLNLEKIIPAFQSCEPSF